MLEDLSGLRSFSTLFAMFALYRTPTIQKASFAAWGLWGDDAFPVPTFIGISITITCNSDPQHWLTIVTCVLPNNLGMLGGILSRLTDMWDEPISTRVAVEAVAVCGDVIDLFILWQRCQTSVRFATVIRLRWELGEPLLDEGGGRYLLVCGGPSQSFQTFQERW